MTWLSESRGFLHWLQVFIFVRLAYFFLLRSTPASLVWTRTLTVPQRLAEQGDGFLGSSCWWPRQYDGEYGWCRLVRRCRVECWSGHWSGSWNLFTWCSHGCSLSSIVCRIFELALLLYTRYSQSDGFHKWRREGLWKHLPLNLITHCACKIHVTITAELEAEK